MTIGNWTNEPQDASASAGLDAFLPAAVFDFHAHLYRVSDLRHENPGLWGEGPAQAGIGVWRERVGRQVGPGRLTGGLFFPAPMRTCDTDGANDYLISQIEADSGSRGLVMITPGDAPEKISGYLDRRQIAGMKPYHVFSAEKDTFQSAILSYLPEWAWELAGDREAVIMLHLVREKALADPGNQRAIGDMCRKYPGVKLILAHAGRGFHAAHTADGIAALSDLDNIWFDTSGICESAALRAVLRTLGPRRLMWGSDFPVSQIRGRCVSVGDGFVWLTSDTVAWEKLSPPCHPVPVGLEALRALREAAEDAGLGADDIRDIFLNNARRLLAMG